jgi:hypothetical protein
MTKSKLDVFPGLAACNRIAEVVMFFAAILATLAVRTTQIVAADALPVRPLPSDLALVPPDALAFVHVRVAEIWQSEVGKAFRQTGAAERGLGELKALEVELGVSVAELDRVTLVVSFPSGLDELFGDGGRNSEPRLVAIVRTLKPYARQRVLDAVAPGAREEKYREKTLYVSSGRARQGAVYFADEQVFAVTERREHLRPVLRHALRARAEGPLTPALTVAQENHFLVAGVSPAAVQMVIFRGMGMGGLGFTLNRLAWSTESLTLKIAPSADKLQGTLDVACFDEREARAAAPAVRAALAILRDVFAEGADEMAAHRRPVVLARLLERLEAAVADARIEQRGTHVTTTIVLPLEQLGTAMAEGFREAQQAADRSRRALQLATIGKAMQIHHVMHKRFATAITDKEGKPLLSWRVAILPLVEQDELYRQFRLDEPWDSPHNKKLLEKMPSIYALPEVKAKEPGTTFYQGFAGPGTVFGNPKGTTIDQITDGCSNTIMVVEAGQPVPWTKPEDLPYDPQKLLPKLGGPQADGFYAVMCDGAVQLIRRDCDAVMLRRAITMNDEEVLDLERLIAPSAPGPYDGRSKKVKVKERVSSADKTEAPYGEKKADKTEAPRRDPELRKTE